MGWYLMDGHFLRKNGNLIKQGSVEWFELQESLGVSKNTAEQVDAIKNGAPVNLNNLKDKYDKDASETEDAEDEENNDDTDTDEKSEAEGGDN
jgi:hypothetical protein